MFRHMVGGETHPPIDGEKHAYLERDETQMGVITGKDCVKE